MWFCIDSCNDVELFDSEEKARAAAQAALDCERDDCGDTGWSDDVTNIMWGKVLGRCELEFERPRTDEDVMVPSDCDTVSDYHLVRVADIPNAGEEQS